MTPSGTQEERTAWIALAAVDGLGEHLVPRLSAAFGGAAAVMEAARSMDASRFGHRLRSAAQTGLRPATVDQVRAAASRALASIQKAQAPWYTTNKQVCASCHHQYQPAIAYRVARDRQVGELRSRRLESRRFRCLR